MAKERNNENSALLTTFEGKEYYLRYDFNRICDMEEYCGKDLMQIVNSGLTGVRMCIYWGLKDYKKMDAEKAGNICKHIMNTYEPEDEDEDPETGLEYIGEVVKKLLIKGKFLNIEEEDEDEDEESEDLKKNS